MKLKDIVSRIRIDPRKLTHYALDPKSPRGKDKAILFEKSLGFTIDNYADLIYQLETKSLETQVTFHSEDEFGKRYTADVSIEGIEGQQATVRTGWIVSSYSDEARLATIFVIKR